MALPALNQEIEQQLLDLSRTGRCVDPKDILEVVESVFASISGEHASLNHRYDTLCRMVARRAAGRSRNVLKAQ